MNKILIVFFILIIPMNVSKSQVENISVEENEKPKIYLETLGFASNNENTSRLDVYIQIPFDGLSFIKKNNIFSADYELSISIQDNLDEPVKEKLWMETVQTSSYNETISWGRSKLSYQSFELPPGSYKIKVQIRDAQTKKTMRLSGKYDLRDFSKKPLAVSDIMILDKLTVDGDKKTIIPNVSGTIINIDEGIYFFIEVYNRLSSDSIKIEYSIITNKGKTVRQGTNFQELTSGKNPIFVKVDTIELPMGVYHLDMRLIPNQINEILNISRNFQIKWRGIPKSVVDLETALNQMIYIIDPKEINRIKNLSPTEKQEAFKAIWKKRDPTPNTERNELMEEYYSRVEYANKHFKHHIEGWRTDMGMVYIIFGAPNNIERYPYSINSKPYEIWHYYELNREVVFIDNTGFGDYQLVTPIWDIYHRIR